MKTSSKKHRLYHWRKYYQTFKRILRDESFREGVSRATTNYEHGIVKLLEDHPESEIWAQEVRTIKERSIQELPELLKITKDAFEEKGVEVIVVKDKGQALSVFDEIIGAGKVIVKGKSMTTEEIHLRQHLIARGNEVWETDLGEFIIQLLDDRPMHVVTPSLHVPREQVARVFTKYMGKKLNSRDVNAMVLAAREFLREKYFQADFGILGANVISAQDGLILSIHNEGNIRFSGMMPENLIFFTGIEKIVPTFEDAMKVALVTARYAKYKVAGYYDVWGATEDFKSRDVSLILLDNGRSSMIADEEFREAAYCLRCGACMYPCPVFKVIAGNFGGSTYVGGIGAIWTWFVEGKERAAPAVFSCLNDGSCKIHCPIDIDIPRMILRLREKVIQSQKLDDLDP